MTILKELKNKGTSTKNGRLRFMALMPEIEEALDAQYMVIDVWRLLTEQEKLSIQYSTFNGYVKKYIRSRHNRLTPSQVPLTSEDDASSTEPIGNLKKIIPGLEKPETSGFKMDSDVRTSGIKDLLK